MARTGKSLAELAGVMSVYPQILVNVSGVDRAALHTDEPLAVALAEAEAELGETGRVLLRPSGTEPLVRVMVEAADQPTADRLAHRLADVVRERLRILCVLRTPAWLTRSVNARVSNAFAEGLSG